MNRTALMLAALRLAPLQCASWGHPITTGLSSIDVYLSGSLLEPPDGERHYTERLVRLPGTGVCHIPHEAPTVTAQRADFGLPDDAILLACCQTPFKYRPFHDAVFARIAHAVPNARFVFYRPSKGAPLFDLLMERMSGRFSAEGLRPEERILVLPHLDAGRFEASLRLMDVYLDSIGFSGFNTAFHSLSAGLPVLTLRGTVMRGRLAAALLEWLGLEDTIADSIDEYVRLAVRLCTDTAWRDEMKRRTRQPGRRMSHDLEPVRALETFIEQQFAGG